MITFKNEKLNKSDGQMNIDKYRMAAHQILFIIS